MEGPHDKVVTVLGVANFKTELAIAEGLTEDFSYLAKKKLGDVLHAEQKATVDALTKVSRPVVEITVPEVSAESLGELFMFYEIQTALSGKLYDIDPFDQPGVELGKKLTKELLSL